MIKEKVLSKRAVFALNKQMPAVEAERPMKQHDGPSIQPTKQRHTAFSMNEVIGWILQGGVIISSAVICVGLVLALIHPGQLASKQTLVFPHTLADVWSGLLVGQPQSVIALGLLLLLATPVIRVTASIVAFALEHDRRYVVITAVVLLVLLLGFLLGKGAG